MLLVDIVLRVELRKVKLVLIMTMI
jgi:hypothetical protein